MCGLVGFSGKKGKQFNMDYIKLLMFWNFKERGKDSTGIYTPKTGVIKTIQSADKFLIDNEHKIKLDSMFIGHVRQSSVGTVKESSAHPFQYKWCTGAHNGTLTNYVRLANEFDLKYSDYDTDSQVLFQILSKTMDSTIFEQITGSFAVLFSDSTKSGFKKTSNHVLYAIRNEERPIFYGELPEGIYFSSIKESLEFIGCENIVDLPIGVMHTFVDGKLENEKVIKLQPKITSSSNNYMFDVHKMEDIKFKWVKKDHTGAKSVKDVSKFLIKNIDPNKEDILIPADTWLFVIDAFINTGGSKTLIVKTKFEDDELYTLPHSQIYYGGEYINVKLHSYVVIMHELLKSDKTGIELKYGDVYKVNSFTREFIDVVINGKTIKLTYSHIRPASFDEEIYTNVITKNVKPKDNTLRLDFHNNTPNKNSNLLIDPKHWDNCTNCSGTGMGFYGGECLECEGTGVVPKIEKPNMVINTKTVDDFDISKEKYKSYFYRFLRKELKYNKDIAAFIETSFQEDEKIEPVIDLIESFYLDVIDDHSLNDKQIDLIIDKLTNFVVDICENNNLLTILDKD